MRRGAGIAPFVRQRDAQAPGVAPDQLAIGLGRRPERHEFAGRSTPAGIDEGRGVAHAAADAALDRNQPGQVRHGRRQRIDAARHFQADQAVDAGRNPDRTAAIGCVRDRQHTGGHHRRRPRGGAAGGVVGIPGIAGDIECIFGRAADAEFRRGAAADDVQPGLADLAGEKAVLRGPVALHDGGAEFLQPPPQRRAEILHQIGHAGEHAGFVHAVSGGIGDHVVEDLDDGVERGVEPGYAGGGLCRKFGRRQIALAHAVGQRHRVMCRPFVPVHRQCHVVRSGCRFVRGKPRPDGARCVIRASM